MQGMMKDVHEAALNVVEQGAQEYEVFMMTFNNRPQIASGFTTDRRQITNSMFGLGSQGNTALYDAVDAALDYVKQGKHRKNNQTIDGRWRKLKVAGAGHSNERHIGRW